MKNFILTLLFGIVFVSCSNSELRTFEVTLNDGTKDTLQAADMYTVYDGDDKKSHLYFIDGNSKSSNVGYYEISKVKSARVISYEQ